MLWKKCIGDRIMIHIFIVGSKGIPAKYGGFETFVDNLTAQKRSNNIMYHVSCMDNPGKVFKYNGAECFGVKVPCKGAPGRIFHVSLALKRVEKWCKKHPNTKVIIYILGCRIGPLLIPHSYRLHKLGAKIFCNPDGLEWKRDKWNALAKRFLRLCERCLVRYSDLSICDSVNIEKYINKTYPGKKTKYIAYGADITKSSTSDQQLQKWYDQFKIIKGNYYLIVGRFVPENNFETMIKEFMRSSTQKDLVIITNVEKNKFYEKLIKKTCFENDKRIKFVGTVYDQSLLKKIREEAYGYIHGHEVGGTNPSLLEALGSTKLNLLLNVGFNNEVGGEGALYWTKKEGSLSNLIKETDFMDGTTINMLDKKSTERVKNYYSWEKICRDYESVFIEGGL